MATIFEADRRSKFEDKLLPTEIDRTEKTNQGISPKSSYSILWPLGRFAANWLPSVLTLLVLGGTAMLGHRLDWKIPKFSELWTASKTPSVAWCESHGVPEAQCIVCNVDLIEKSPALSFCQLHGVKGCVLCNPELAQTKETPLTTASDSIRAEKAIALMPRQENLPTSTLPGQRVQFASLDAMKKSGVDVELVERRAVVEKLTASGEVRYDETKTTLVSPQTDGITSEVMVVVGEWVERGALLAWIDSPEVGKQKAELYAALKELRIRESSIERLKPLAGSAVPMTRVIDLEKEIVTIANRVEAATSTLASVGIPIDLRQLAAVKEDDQLRGTIDALGLSGLRTNNSTTPNNHRNLIAIVAPMSGRVVSREVTRGQVLSRGVTAFQVSDNRSMWLDINLPSESVSNVAIGQDVVFRPDGSRLSRQGKVTWISTDVDAQTRTVRVRAELLNDDGTLRNESFGKADIILRDEKEAITIPESALQWTGTEHLVFVRDKRFFEPDRPKFFIARSVRPAVKQDGFVEILAGLLPGEVVATKGSDVLRAQLLKSGLGAGCTCGH